MPQDLKSFMVRLATDLDSLTQFITDPQRATEGSGLSAESRAILFSADQGRIYAAVANPPQPQAAWTPAQERPAQAQPAAAQIPQAPVHAMPQYLPLTYGCIWWPQTGWTMPWYGQ